MRVRGALAAASIVTAALVVAGCASAGPSAAPASASPTTVETIAPTASDSPSPSASAPASASASAAISPGQPSGVPGVDVVMDPALLEILPAAIGSAKVGIEPDSFAQAVQDASFVASVDRAAFAIVLDSSDWASGVVAHLRPGVYSDALYRDWRDSYDEGACGQAGGVATHAEVGTNAGGTMYVTTCSGGLRVYHAYVPERQIIVSVFSLGEGRFGQQLVAGLRP